MKIGSDTSKMLKLGNGLLSIAEVLFCLVMLAVAIMCVFFTGHSYLAEGNSETFNEFQRFWSLASFSGVLAIVLSVVCGLVMFLAFWGLYRCKFFDVNPKKFFVVSALFLLIVQIAWIVCLEAKSGCFSDSLALKAIGEYITTGQFELNFKYQTVEELYRYLNEYPFQSGAAYLFAGYSYIFGENIILAFQVSNAFCNVAIALVLAWITWMITGKRICTNICSLLCALCAPLIFSCAFVYPNTIGFLFAILSIALTIFSLKQKTSKKKMFVFLIFAFVSIALSIALKNTYILFLIVIVVLMLIESIRAKSPAIAGVVLVLALLANCASSLSIRALEFQMGVDFEEGYPKTSWIALGLSQHDEGSIPGWWFPLAEDIKNKANGDYDEQVSLGVETIKGSLKTFANNPKYCIYFFGKKLISEWTDPYFQSMYYSNISGKEKWVDKDLNDVAKDLQFGKSSKVLTILADGMQNVIIICTLFYALNLFRRRKNDGQGDKTLFCILPSCVVLGFLVYVLWEAKSVYLMPFYLCILPLASAELKCFCEKFSVVSAKKSGDAKLSTVQ